MHAKPDLSSICTLLLVVMFWPEFDAGGELYKWVDEEGTVHMTDNLSQIPPQYRVRIDAKAAQLSSDQSKGASPGATPQSPANFKHFAVPYHPFEGSSRRIIIPVTLNDSVPSRLLLDTGSPGLLISPDLANRLGLPDDQHGGLKVMAAGIGGSTSAIFSVVDSIQVGEARTEFLPATVAKVPSNEFEGLVGMDFMANYQISIDNKNNLLVFSELPSQAERPGGHDASWWRSNFQTFAKFRSDWSAYIRDLQYGNMTSSEKELRIKAATEQYYAADELWRKLERYARENAVPIDWRR
jgi:hypothetical protein